MRGSSSIIYKRSDRSLKETTLFPFRVAVVCRTFCRLGLCRSNRTAISVFFFIAGRGLQPRPKLMLPGLTELIAGVCNPYCRTGFATPSETYAAGDWQNIADGCAYGDKSHTHQAKTLTHCLYTTAHRCSETAKPCRTGLPKIREPLAWCVWDKSPGWKLDFMQDKIALYWKNW